MRLSGSPQNSPILSARSKSGSMRTWSSSAAGAGPRASQAFAELLLQLIRPHGEPETNGVDERGDRLRDTC